MFLIYATDDLQRFLKLLAEERKSASFFFVAPQRKLRSSKAQLRLNILNATFNRNFMTGFGMVKPIKVGSYSVVVKSSAEKFDELGSNLAKIRICWTNKYLI